MERFSQAGNVRSYFPRNFSVMLSEGMSLTPGCLGQENQFCWKRTFVLSKILLLLSSESQAFQDGNRWCKVTLELAGLTDRQTSFHPSPLWLPLPGSLHPSLAHQRARGGLKCSFLSMFVLCFLSGAVFLCVSLQKCSRGPCCLASTWLPGSHRSIACVTLVWSVCFAVMFCNYACY